MNDPLTRLLKEPIIYFLPTFEASILGNNSEFGTVSSQFIKHHYYERAPAYHTMSRYCFQTSLESLDARVVSPGMRSYQAHDVL